jgi:hypothetical protein
MLRNLIVHAEGSFIRGETTRIERLSYKWFYGKCEVTAPNEGDKLPLGTPEVIRPLALGCVSYWSERQGRKT